MSSNRYSSLNRRPAPSSALFADYPGANSRPSSSSAPRPNGYGNYTSSNHTSPYASNSHTPQPSNTNASPYPTYKPTSSPPPNAYRSATPNKKGQYPTSVYSSLESQPAEAYPDQSDAQTSLLSSKVAQLKQLTVAIGDEIRDSSSLAQTINEQFEGSSVRLKGTYNRMMRMAERTGVGWRVWLGFFFVLWCLFAYVWLF